MNGPYVTLPDIAVIALPSAAAGLGAAWLALRSWWPALRGHDRGMRLIFILDVTTDLENACLLVLGVWLRVLNRWMGDSRDDARQDVAIVPEPSCWTGASFDACMKACLLAPVAGLLASWFLTGDAGMLGGTVGLVRGALVVTRLASFVTAAQAGLCFIRGLRSLRKSGWRAALWIGVGLSVAGLVDQLLGPLDPASQSARQVDDGTFLGSVALGSMAVLAVRLSGTRVLGLAAVGMAAVAVSGNGPVTDLVAFCAAFALAEAADRSGDLRSLWRLAWPLGMAGILMLLVCETIWNTPGRGRVALAFLDVLPFAIVPPVWTIWETARFLCGQTGRRGGPSPIVTALCVLTVGGAGSLLLAGLAGAMGLTCGNAQPLLHWGDMAAWPGHICVWPHDRWPGVIALPILLPLLPTAANLVLLTFGVAIRSISPLQRARSILGLQRLRDEDMRSRLKIVAPVVLACFAAGCIGCGAVLAGGLALVRSGPDLASALLGLVMAPQ